jgi:hypothetical protein
MSAPESLTEAREDALMGLDEKVHVFRPGIRHKGLPGRFIRAMELPRQDAECLLGSLEDEGKVAFYTDQLGEIIAATDTLYHLVGERIDMESHL